MKQWWLAWTRVSFIGCQLTIYAKWLASWTPRCIGAWCSLWSNELGLWRRLRIRCQELGNGTQFSVQTEHILSLCITGSVHGFSHVKSCHSIVPFPCVNFCSFEVCEHGCNASAAESPRLDDRMGKLEARRQEAASISGISHPILSFSTRWRHKSHDCSVLSFFRRSKMS